MNKNARKSTKPQPRPETSERTLHLAEIVRHNLYAFIIHEGRKALDELLEQDRERVCGPAHAKGTKGGPVRWGHAEGRLTMGGHRVLVRKPRVRHEGAEVPLPSWDAFADEDPLNDRTFEQMVLGVSTRKYDRSLEPLPEELAPHGASKTAASRRFVATTKAKLDAWQSRDLSQLHLVSIMLDGIVVRGQTVIVALGLDESGKKHPLGLYLGATENATICGELLDDLIARGVASHRPYLFVIDGSKALRKALHERFGKRSFVQRCQEHKRRNVRAHLPKSKQSSADKRMRDAYNSSSKATAKRLILKLVTDLEEAHPDAARSLKEGLDETLTLKDMNLLKSLERTLSTTNPIENLNGSIRRVSRRVKNWRDGTMIKRWVAVSILEAERGFRRLRGYKGIPALLAILTRHAEQIDRVDDSQEVA
jgi:transposase-like protein